MSSFDNFREEALKKLGLTHENSGIFSGHWHKYTGENAIESCSPVDGKSIALVSSGTAEDYSEVIDHQMKVFREWSSMPAPKRGEIIREVGMELRRRKADLGDLVTLEVGKTASEGQGEIQEMIDVADFAVGLSRQLYGLTMTSERPNHRLYEQWVPLGPIAVISSFNFPSSVWSWNAFVAAVAGDPVIWKPSSKAPLTALAVIKIISDVLQRLHAPQIFSLIIGGGSNIGDKIARDSRIPLVSFTGSIPIGKTISEKVAGRFGRSILELGGNNAAIVSARSDMDIALKGVVFGALATAGQRCTSTRRAIVQETIYDRFIERLKKAYSTVKIGSPTSRGVLVGPLIDRVAVDAFLSAIEQAKKEGGKLIYGGNKAKVEGFDDGYYVNPAIVEANDRMEIVKKETFAPILYVFKYKNIGDAIRIHNSVPQGLSSSIFTYDLREEEEFLSTFGSDCGLANVNTSTAGAEIGGAFGGEKETGGGRESGSDSWKAYMRRQTVTKNWGNDIPLAQDVKFDI
ncbi:MAG: aldehyde dehydrogenase family protein [Thermoplasmataceae archaeon]